MAVEAPEDGHEGERVVLHEQRAEVVELLRLHLPAAVGPEAVEQERRHARPEHRVPKKLQPVLLPRLVHKRPARMDTMHLIHACTLVHPKPPKNDGAPAQPD